MNMKKISLFIKYEWKEMAEVIRVMKRVFFL